MLEEICKALSEETNIRENLIELKKSIKDKKTEENEHKAKHEMEDNCNPFCRSGFF